MAAGLLAGGIAAGVFALCFVAADPLHRLMSDASTATSPSPAS